MMIKREMDEAEEQCLEKMMNVMILKERIATLKKSAQQDAAHNRHSKPCSEKLRNLSVLTSLLSKKNHQIQSQSVDLGILRVAAMWLLPHPDGTLPENIIRTSILQSLTREFYVPNLPQPDMSRFKYQVVESGLATAVAKLSDCTDETESNRKIANDLISNWLCYFYYSNSTNTSSTCNKIKPSVQQRVQRKITTARGRSGLGVKERIEKRFRQLHNSTHRHQKFKCHVPVY